MEQHTADNAAAIVIAGCHRSGTSAVAGALAALGWSPPVAALGAMRGNARGHFEPMAMVEANDRVLEACRRSWYDPKPLPAGWRELAAAAAVAAASEGVLGSAFPVGPAVVKDPRLSLLLPVWQRALDGLGGPPLVVIACRNPYEVAKSLRLRNGLGVPHGLALWHSYVLQAERNTRGMRRMVIHYEQLIAEGALVLGEIAAMAGRTVSVEQLETAATTLTAGARHVRIDPQVFLRNGNVMDEIRQTYRKLLMPGGVEDRDYFDRTYSAWADAWHRESPDEGPSHFAVKSAEHFHVQSHRALEAGDVDASLTQAENAVAMAPRQAVTHFQLGKVLMRAGRHGEAVAALRRALQLNPVLPGGATQLAVALRSTGAAEESLAVAQQALRAQPEDMALAVQTAQMLAEAGDSREAVWQAAAAMGLHGPTPAIALALSRSFRRAGRRDVGLGYARQAFASAAGDAAARIQAAIQVAKCGETAEAVRLLGALLAEGDCAEQAQAALDRLAGGAAGKDG